MQKDLREMIRTIIEYVFRRKGLNYVLYIMAAFWIREATNLSASEGIETLLNAIKGDEPFPHWRYLIASIGAILFTEGSWLIFTLTSAMILFFGFLKYKEISNGEDVLDHIVVNSDTIQVNKVRIDRSKKFKIEGIQIA